MLPYPATSGGTIHVIYLLLIDIISAADSPNSRVKSPSESLSLGNPEPVIVTNNPPVGAAVFGVALVMAKDVETAATEPYLANPKLLMKT